MKVHISVWDGFCMVKDNPFWEKSNPSGKKEEEEKKRLLIVDT